MSQAGFSGGFGAPGGKAKASKGFPPGGKICLRRTILLRAAATNFLSKGARTVYG
ncbi:hypothetical protein AB7M35_002363 [Amorphus suaedae]